MNTKKKIVVLGSLLLAVIAAGIAVWHFFPDNRAAHSLYDPSENWLPEDTPVQMSETKPLPELAHVIAETYGIPREEWNNTCYYYNYVDLNEDGEEEIFVVVMGLYTSGSGGDSALLVLPYAGMTVSQTFTLVRTPILVSEDMTGGAHDLVFLRSGGGGSTELVRLTCVDGIYSMVSNAEVLPFGKVPRGRAILGNDFLADRKNGSLLTLADS